MSKSDESFLAKAIFDYLNGPEVVAGADSQPPYTYDDDPANLIIGIDGKLDCKVMADAIKKSIGAFLVEADGREQIDPFIDTTFCR